MMNPVFKLFQVKHVPLELSKPLFYGTVTSKSQGWDYYTPRCGQAISLAAATSFPQYQFLLWFPMPSQ